MHRHDSETDTDINMVPYRGSAPALNDLLGGHIDVMFDAMPMMSVQAKEGKVTPLAVTGQKRSPTLPGVGTMKDSGLTYEITAWHERLGMQTAMVTVGANDTKTQAFKFALFENGRHPETIVELAREIELDAKGARNSANS